MLRGYREGMDNELLTDAELDEWERTYALEHGVAATTPEEEDWLDANPGCECEVDWNCGCGRWGGHTPEDWMTTWKVRG